MKNLTSKEILMGVIILALVVGFISYWEYSRYKINSFKDLANANKILDGKVKEYTDQNGVLHATVQALNADRDAYHTIYAKQVDSLARIFNVRTKEIEELLFITQTTIGNIKSRVDTSYRVDTVHENNGSIVYDTVRYLSFPYKDKWMDFDGKIENGKFDASYIISDSISLLSYTKKQGIFGLGGKKYYVDITNSNPHTVINSMKNVELKNLRPKRWSLGPYFGYGTNGKGFSPQAGIGLQFGLFRF